jgi:tetratricopeptide (TPR) repeat protein
MARHAIIPTSGPPGRSMRLQVLSACLVGLTVSFSSLSAQTRVPQPKIPQPKSIYEFLDRYVHGDFAAAREFAATVTEKQIRAVEDQAGRWVDANRATVAQRRLAAATFALDASYEWHDSSPKWANAQRLIAWACGELSKTPGPPQPGERLWFQASIALLSGAQDWMFLLGSPKGRRSGKPGVDEEFARGHLSHALARFPNEPVFTFASAVAVESMSWEVGAARADPNRRGMIPGEIPRDPGTRNGTSGNDDFDDQRPAAPPRRRGQQNFMPGAAEVRDLATQFVRLSSEPPVAAEANLRAGLLQYRLSDPDGALNHVAQTVTLTNDAYLVYLSKLVEGVIRERQDRLEEAAAAYRAALDAVPRAQSATVMLTSTLMRLGRIAEASAISESFLAPGPPVIDPWRQYRLGEFRSWPSLMTRLREQFR